jgi:hypothetical protein
MRSTFSSIKCNFELHFILFPLISSSFLLLLFFHFQKNDNQNLAPIIICPTFAKHSAFKNDVARNSGIQFCLAKKVFPNPTTNFINFEFNPLKAAKANGLPFPSPCLSAQHSRLIGRYRCSKRGNIWLRGAKNTSR